MRLLNDGEQGNGTVGTEWEPVRWVRNGAPGPQGVGAATRTTTALLDGLSDSTDQATWSEFDRRYRPVVIAVARGMGLSETDAADAAQETLMQFVRDYRAGSFDRTRGRLRHWISGIARHRIADMRRRGGGGAARGAMRGESAFDLAANGEHELDRLWERACQREMLMGAVDELRRCPNTGTRALSVLELLFVRQVTPAQAAGELGITAQEVYAIKSRLAERLRKLLEDQRALFEEG